MKKIVSLFLACVLCLGLLAGCQGEPEPWTAEDLMYYDDEGNSVELKYSGVKDSLSQQESKKGRVLRTKRDVKIGDPAKEALRKYPLEESYASYMDVEGNSIKELDEKYSNGIDCLNNLDAIVHKMENGNTIFVSVYLSEEGELLHTNERGKEFLMFFFVITIENSNAVIRDINISKTKYSY